jgi:spore germination protein KB
MIFVCAVACRLGIEVVAREAQTFVPHVILGWMIIIILLIPDMDINFMFPIMEEGIIPIFKGSFQLSNWFLHFIVLTFLFPLVSDQKNTLKWEVISVIAITPYPHRAEDQIWLQGDDAFQFGCVSSPILLMLFILPLF